MRIFLKILLLIIGLLVLSFLIFRHPDKSVEELSRLYTDEESEWVEMHGMSVHYKKEGSGPVLVLIHGTGASLHTWDEWAERLDDSLTVYRMDLPAFGLTGPEPNGNYSMQMYVDFVDAFAQRMQLDSFAIGGNSLGGAIAWSYTVDHPDKVSKLLLLDSAGYPHEGASDALAFKIASNPILRPIMRQITPKSYIRQNLEQVYGDDSKITDELVTRYHDMALREGNRRAFIDRVHTEHKDISGRISEIECPTLIMWGSEDTWTPVEDAAKFNRDISNSTMIMYDGVGHVPMEEIPQRSAEDAMDFLMDDHALQSSTKSPKW